MGATERIACFAFMTLFLAFLISPLARAEGADSADANQVLGDPELTAIALRIAAELHDANLSGMSEAEAAEYFRTHALVVMGSSLDSPERALFEAAKAKYPFINNATYVSDNGDAVRKMESGTYKFAALVGGPGQNFATKKAIENGWLNETQTAHGELVVQYGRVNGTLLIAFSDTRGYANANREGAKYSPLALLGVPIQYVPATATIISAILLALFEITRTVFEFKALGIGRKGKKVGHGAVFLFNVNLREIFSFIFASFVLGASISWMYFGPSLDFIFWLFVNSFICLLAAIIHEFTHRVFAWIFKVKMEYRVWWGGSFLTLLSSFLGNAFSVQGYILEEIDEKTSKWKIILLKLSAPLVSAFFMVFFAAINVFFPSQLFQMIYSISALWAIAEILPFRGLDGNDLIKINFFAWLVPFIFVGTLYVIITFFL